MSSSTLLTWTWSIHESHLILFLYPNCTNARRVCAEMRGKYGPDLFGFPRTQEASLAFVLLSNSKIIMTILITGQVAENQLRGTVM